MGCADRERFEVMGANRLKVLMVGPARSVHGGISGVVNNYFDAGLDQMIDLYYIGTMVEGTKFVKLLQAIKAYLRFLVRLPKYDIIHVNVASDSSYIRKSVFIRTAKTCGKKVVIHQHGGNFPEFYEKELSESGRKRVQKVLAMGDAFLVLGTSWLDFFGEIIGRERITVLPNAISVPKREEKKNYGVHKILYLGRLCEAKGIGELLAVLPKLRERYPDVRLYLAGLWESRELQKRAEALREYVTAPGWIEGEEKRRLLQECDIFVLPSYFEGQPVSVLEAMAYACGIVTTRTGSIPDMIKENETGIFAVPEDIASLEESLEKLLGDPELCRRLGENARQKVEADFSIDNNLKQLLAVYETISCREPQHEN